jgi:hypothetical protein
MLNRRGLLILGSAAASLTLIGNRQVLALVPETDRYHRAAAGAQHLINTLHPEYYAWMEHYRAAPPEEVWDRRETWNLRALYFQTDEAIRIKDAFYESMSKEPGSPYRLWLSQADEHLREMMDNFPEMPSLEMATQVIDGKVKVDIFSDAELRELVPGIVPLAITRAMVQTYRVPYHMKHMPNFVRIGERYRNFVMA